LAKYFRKTYAFPLRDLLVNLSREARNSLDTALTRRLAVPAQQVAAYEWQVFLNTPFLQSRPTAGGWEDGLHEVFFDGGVESQTSTFGRLYPELMRLWVLQMENWSAFLRIFQCDLAKFVRRQAIGSPAARIVALRPDMSDFHNGNTTVVHVSFATGEEWFYKPRCAHQGTLWFELLSRINRAGFSHPFTLPRLVLDQNHHWMEAIREHPCRSFGQQRDFWFRSGALLWLVNAFAGVDFHVGNLICHGDQPVFVDCETLLHPLPSGAQDRISLATRLGRTGMLPVRESSDTAALGLRTASRVCGRRRPLSARDICCSVVDGWKAMTKFFTEPKRRRILLDIYAQLQSTDCRVIPRSTAQYHSILRYSLSPTLLKDSTRRLQFLRQACQSANASQSVADKEASALADLDIPVFFGSCRQSTALFPPSQSKHGFRTLASRLRAAFPHTNVVGGKT
jgi:lantibiotic modifying enzyme